MSEGRPARPAAQPLLRMGRGRGARSAAAARERRARALRVVRPRRRARAPATAFDRDERGVVAVPNRRSWQAGLGGSHWAAIDPRRARRLPDAGRARPPARKAGLEPQRLRQPPLGRNQLWMWQTLLNAFTFHDDFAVRRARPAGCGRQRAQPARVRDRRVVSVLAALPVALDLAAARAGRGRGAPRRPRGGRGQAARRVGTRLRERRGARSAWRAGARRSGASAGRRARRPDSASPARRRACPSRLR